MKPNLEKLNKIADRINRSAKILLKKNSLPSNLDLKFQIENQIEYFKLLNQLKAECRKKNLNVMMVTLIVYHKKSDPLEKSYKILRSATSKLFHSSEYQRFLDLISVQDYIKRLEIEYCDDKGWHPHFHILLICENSIAVESAESYEKKFSTKYLKMCINSGMSKTQKIKDFMTESGVDITPNFEYLSYVSDYKKLLKPRIDKLSEKYFSPYVMSTYKGYEDKFKEYAKFVKGKKIFEFSRPSICGINFVEWKEVDKIIGVSMKFKTENLLQSFNFCLTKCCVIIIFPRVELIIGGSSYGYALSQALIGITFITLSNKTLTLICSPRSGRMIKCRS